jgi:hypothetical protein
MKIMMTMMTSPSGQLGLMTPSSTVRDVFTKYLVADGPIVCRQVILGVGGVFVQFVLLGPIMKALGESRTLCFGLMVQIVYYLGLVIALSKVQVFATIALGSLSMVTFPSISRCVP